jgi:hypothetical protein
MRCESGVAPGFSRSPIVQSVQALQQAVSSMHESLQDLPAAISAEVTAALEPLGTLRQDVKMALEAYGEITELQRQRLDALALEMIRSATQAFHAQVKQLDTTLGDLSQTLSDLKINPERNVANNMAINAAASVSRGQKSKRGPAVLQRNWPSVC